MDTFEDIRPYLDHEVRGAVAALAEDPEFVALTAGLMAPRWSRRIPALAHAVIRALVRRQARRLNSVADLQELTSRFIKGMLRRTSDGLTTSGLEHLEPSAAHLFVSNHRDITLDPALLNYTIHHAGHATSQIAIGDNLLDTGFRDELMRLNKAFIVHRAVTGAKAQLEVMRRTSAYLRSTLEAGESVWVAQRGGRSKDGLDRTEPAIVKMFLLAHRSETRSIGEWLRRVRLTPVSISYELDPCAPIKARELYFTARDGHYDKPSEEDARSIEAGISGFKGRIHLGFSEPISGDFADAEALAADMDRRIIAGLVTYPTHDYARALVNGQTPAAGAMSPRVRSAFLAGLASCADEYQPHFLRQYANQIENRLAKGAASG